MKHLLAVFLLTLAPLLSAADPAPEVGEVRQELPLLPGRSYRVRAVAAHPVLDVFSGTVRVKMP